MVCVRKNISIKLDTAIFCLKESTVRLSKGKDPRVTKYNTFKHDCGMRCGIVYTKNKNNLCLPRALVVAKAYADNNPDYGKVRWDIGKTQMTRA